MKFKAKLSKGEYGGYIILIDEKRTKKVHALFGKRVLCKINGLEFHCAIQKSIKLGHYIYFSKNRIKEVEAIPTEKFEVIFEKDTSKYQMHVCEELEEILFSDPEGEKKFDALLPGKQRGLIHYVNSAKRTGTRIDRALLILERVKRGYTDPKEIIAKRD